VVALSYHFVARSNQTHHSNRLSHSAKRVKLDLFDYRSRFGVRSCSILSTIRLASATASAIAATYNGLFLGAVANFRAARIDAQKVRPFSIG